MKKLNFYRSAVLAVVGLFALVTVSGSNASAIAYESTQTVASPIPAYNVFTGVPTTGNESDFLRARFPINNSDSDATTQFSDPSTTCADGQRIQMRVYVHNGASATANNNGTGPSVIHGARVVVNVPTETNDKFTPTAALTGSNVASVNDGVTINCNGKKVKLHYITGSASQYSIGSGVVPLSDNIVTSGVSIRSQKVDGDVWGCWNERVYVVLALKVEVVTEPVTPVTATCDLFKFETDDDRTVKVSQFKYTGTNATFKNAVINWDSGKTNVSTAAITDANKLVGQTHKYAADGTYIVTTTVHFTTEASTDLVASTENCKQSVTFKTNTPPVVVPVTVVTTPVTPGTPVTPAVVAAPAATVLPNTGAGSTIALFAAVSLAAAFAHRWFAARRFSA